MKQDRKRQRIVCIVGPTACHKTECSIELASRVSGEIVSADSVQVYFGMDIGSAKPLPSERRGIPHHLIDCLPIDAPEFSVSMFREMAAAAIGTISARGSVPIIVGGSGLYVNALTFPLGFAIPQSKEARDALSKAYDEKPEAVYARLLQIDPETGNRLHLNDKKRIVRALEVFESAGRTLSSFGGDFRNAAGEEPSFDPLLIGLNMDRDLLYARIDRRVDQMMECGLLDEARRIYEAGYGRTLPAMSAIGYKELFSFMDGECSLPSAIEKIKQDTRRFAKRQLTWFRRDTRIRWYDVTHWDTHKGVIIEEISQMTKQWMKGKAL
jgi:tRNA dimethylallyltransferase